MNIWTPYLHFSDHYLNCYGIYNFLSISEIPNYEQLTSCDVIREGSGGVDHEFVEFVGNWMTAPALIARGGRGGSRGWRHGPFGRRSELR